MSNFIKKHNDIIGGIANLIAIFVFIAGIIFHIYSIHILSEAKKSNLQYELRDFQLRWSHLSWQETPTNNEINIEKINIEDIKTLFKNDKFCKFTFKYIMWRDIYPQMKKMVQLQNEIDELNAKFWRNSMISVGLFLVICVFKIKKCLTNQSS